MGKSVIAMISKVVAIRRFDRLLCRKCIWDSAEMAAWVSPETSSIVMEEKGITVVRANELPPGSVCGMCGSKLETPK
jgi:hypothetical protein